MNKSMMTFVLLIFIVINGGVYQITEVDTKQRVAMVLDESINTLRTHYEILLYTQDITAKTLYDATIKNREFIKIFSEVQGASKEKRAKLREQMQELLSEMYARAKLQDVLQYQFIFPDNTVFLRMHKPSKFGDDLTKIRDDFRYVNQTKKPLRGFTQGRTAHGFRNAFPIFDEKGKHLGAMEVSFSSDSFQRYLNKVSHIHTHFLVDKKLFEAKAWKRDDMVLKYSHSAEDKNLMIAIIEGHSTQKCIVENRDRLRPIRALINNNIRKGKSFSAFVKYHGHTDIVSFLAIKNIEDKTVAWLVSYTTNGFLDYTLEGKHYIRLFTLLISLVVVYFILLQLRAKDKLQGLHTKLERLNTNLEKKVKEALKKNTKQLQLLQQQSKMASMGEMIGAIAHQWRQPLSTISTGIQNLEYDFEEGLLRDEKYVEAFIEKQKKTIRFMSQTIDDFRSFFRVNKEKRDFSVKETTQAVIDMLSAQFKKYEITITVTGDEFTYHGYQSEYQQVVLNLINNAKDALVENSIPNPTIDIVVENRKVTIKDNAGGIPENILNRIFEPYFTTKEAGKGTGMGLYISKMIIEDNMGGSLKAENIEKGALFSINFKA